MTLAEHKKWGVQTDSDYDEYKRIYLETNPVLFTVTCIVTFLHTIFEFMAIKSDIEFWNGKENV
jgi:hypothetical protein